MRARKGRRTTAARRVTAPGTHRKRKVPRKRGRPGRKNHVSSSKTKARRVSTSVRNLLAGRIQAHPEGYGFLVPDDEGLKDVFLSRQAIRPAMQGDRVLVRVVSHGRDRRREGEVARILERASKRLIGVYRKGTRTNCLIPHDPRIPYPMTIPGNAGGGARTGDLVAAEITRYPTSRSDLEGSIVSVLGPAGDPRVETDAVVLTYGLPTGFPPAVQTEAARVPERVSSRALAGRLDLRNLPLVTIDGENARDFDDAVGIEPTKGGGVRLTVAIADVAAYVKAGSATDAEAAHRGTSVYFPDRVIPMLPKALSTGICSLNPESDRLVKVVRVDFSARGRPGRVSFANAVIRSHARLTYTEVARMLVDQDGETRRRHAALVEPLERMEDLCCSLRERRRARGAIDLDLPEAEIELDASGHPTNIVRTERTIAHRMIEEFMLVANEAVARHITARRLPMLHRAHEAPSADAASELSIILEGFGLRLSLEGGRPTPRAYQRIIEAAAGRPQEHLVNRLLLRSMPQARYTAENLGHFGLATDCYTHFTSPIRRYPDLVLHRILGTTLGTPMRADARERLAEMLPAIAEEASRRERIAMDAEREAIALKKVEFMRGKLGEIFGGFVSDVSPFGFFTALDDYFVEGLVHVSTLTDDFYEHVAHAHCLRGRKRHRTIRVGDRVTVRVTGVSVERRQIDFVLEHI